MNELAARLGLEFPLIQAGMGGVAGPRLAAAVADAGAGGVVALYRMRPDTIRGALQQTRALTARPFGVNLIPELVSPRALAEQVEAVVEASDEGVFFTFYGLPDDAVAKRLAGAGRAFVPMVGDVNDVARARALGAAAVVLQGIEAGGHLLGAARLDALVEAAARRAPDVPLLAAGGIASGADFRRLHDRGAAGCLCGTIFVATLESDAHERFKERIVAASADDTVVTDRFDIGWPNRPHRVLRNALTPGDAPRLASAFIASIDVQGARHPVARYSATTPTRHTQGAVDQMPMYAGLSVAGVHAVEPAASRVASFMAQFHAAAPSGGRWPARSEPAHHATSHRR